MVTWPGAFKAAVLATLCLPAAVRTSAAQSPASATAPGVRTAERTLIALENEWAQAVVHRNARALGRFVAARWVYSDESGVMDRAAGIKAFTSGSDTVATAGNRDMHVTVYPGAAVVIGILEMRGRGPAGAFFHRYRYTDTWVLIDGRWQCVASQDYLMPSPATAR
jgi:ketosteroid isomerase-like protein